MIYYIVDLLTGARGRQVFFTTKNTKRDTGELLWLDPVTDTSRGG